ncbi:MAG: hypothetical protein JWQ18_831 [Conexibacter sp.]|nr:hypothetical protein [Conexibacter sp.]
MKMRRTLITMALCALVPATAQAKSSSTVELTAASDTAGAALSTTQHVALTTIDASRFSITRTPSHTAVTLRYPRAHPCATTTVRLTVVPSADPLQAVRAMQPDAFEEGTVLHPPAGQGLLAAGTPTTFAAWRQRDNIANNDQLVTTAVSARKLRVYTKGASTGRDALRVVTISGKTTRTASTCAGASSFTLGPGIDALAQTQAR